MRLSAVILASQACGVTAAAAAIDASLTPFLVNSVLFSGQEYFDLDGAEASTEAEFEKVVKLVENYFEDEAKSTPVAKRVKVLNELIAFKEGDDGKALYNQALKDIRAGPGVGSTAVSKVNRYALEVVYTTYLKDKMKSFTSEHLLRKACSIPEQGDQATAATGADKTPSGKSYDDYLAGLITKEVAKTTCDASVMSTIVTKVQKTFTDATDFEINEANLQYIKEHPTSNRDPLRPNSQYTTGECYESALKWVVQYIVKQQTYGICEPAQRVPPSLNELAPQTFNGASPPILDDLLALDAHYGSTPPSLDDILLHQSRNQASPEYTLPDALPNTLPNTSPSTLPNTVSNDSPPSLDAILALQSYDESSDSLRGKSSWSATMIGACAGTLITVAVYHVFSRRISKAEE